MRELTHTNDKNAYAMLKMGLYRTSAPLGESPEVRLRLQHLRPRRRCDQHREGGHGGVATRGFTPGP